MAFFTKFKKAKDAAVEHKKAAAAQETKAPAAPYRHVPTHAAQDALSSQPTTLKPAELQARIIAARKRRASSYQPPLPQRHSLYHSCESSRASSRAPSIAGYSPHSTPPSLKGKNISDPSIDAIMKRPRSVSHRHSSPMANAHLQPGEYFPQIPEGSLDLPVHGSQRSRPPMSTRSSFAKKKSPLSNVAVDEEPEHAFSGSSNTSAVSSQSSSSDDSRRDKLNVRGPRHFSKPNYGVENPQPVVEPSTRRRSKWSILPRKTMSIAAH